MTKSIDKVHIFANKYGNEYLPERLIEDWDEEIDGFEYADVARGEYQVWEYPSGKIYDVVPDRRLDEDANQYSTPYTSQGTVWLPVLNEVGVDVAKVSEAYSQLTKA